MAEKKLAIYLHFFLPPSETFIYQRIASYRQFQPYVLAIRKKNNNFAKISNLKILEEETKKISFWKRLKFLYRAQTDFLFFCEEVLGYKADEQSGFKDLTDEHRELCRLLDRFDGKGKLVLQG